MNASWVCARCSLVPSKICSRNVLRLHCLPLPVIVTCSPLWTDKFESKCCDSHCFVCQPGCAGAKASLNRVVAMRMMWPTCLLVSLPLMVSGEGETLTSLQHQSCLCVVTNDICKFPPEESETREAGSSTGVSDNHSCTVPSTSQWHLMKPDASAERRVEARLPCVEHHLSAVVARVPISEWRHRSN